MGNNAKKDSGRGRVGERTGKGTEEKGREGRKGEGGDAFAGWLSRALLPPCFSVSLSFLHMHPRRDLYVFLFVGPLVTKQQKKEENKTGRKEDKERNQPAWCFARGLEWPWLRSFVRSFVVFPFFSLPPSFLGWLLLAWLAPCRPPAEGGARRKRRTGGGDSTILYKWARAPPHKFRLPPLASRDIQN
jgi:hypothetical protein